MVYNICRFRPFARHAGLSYHKIGYVLHGRGANRQSEGGNAWGIAGLIWSSSCFGSVA